MIVSPTEYLRANLDPISKKIDGFGGYNVLVGFIAAGGEPHIYITGNLESQPTLAKEIYSALSDKFRDMATQKKPEYSVIINPGNT